MNSIDQLTITAYLETDYRVSARSPFVMRVGVANESLAKLYKQFSAGSGTFITACNPFSQIVDEAINADKQAQLARDLSKRSLTFFDGVGKHPSGDWPAEIGYFVLDLSLETAKVLGKKYNQNAIVWCGADAIPELVLLR